jgi:osmotically inducible protein OsmC
MSVRTSTAVWNGTLKEGNGTMKIGSRDFDGAYTFGSRFEEAQGTNPEELIAAAHAGCFSMAFSADLEKAGHKAEKIETTAHVHLEKVNDAPTVTRIVLETKGTVPGISNEDFLSVAEGSKKNCPISRLLAAAEIELKAELV